MSGYKTRQLQVLVGKLSLSLKALKDHNQYYDPKGLAKSRGICSASWSLFGQLWKASEVLANHVKHIKIKNKKIIELGCGLALPALVLNARGANITASDYHPLSQHFLNFNAAANALKPVPYLDLPWDTQNNVGPYDLIIGSDLLYEPNHAKLLAKQIQYLASPTAKVVISCPGRGYRNKFSRALKTQGFNLKEKRVAFEENETPPFKGRLLIYERVALA